MFNAKVPRGGHDDILTDPCPTPAADFIAIPRLREEQRRAAASAIAAVSTASADYDYDDDDETRDELEQRKRRNDEYDCRGDGVPCRKCDTNLFEYRHRILVLERDLEWSKNSMELLVNTAQRSKRDATQLYSQLLHENYSLKLGMGVPDHIADIEKGKVVSMVQRLPQHLEREHRIIELQEQIRKLNAGRHREEAAHNASVRKLRSQVGSLQESLERTSKEQTHEIDTLRQRLNRLRHGARAQELRRVAGAARSLRSTLNRLRHGITDMLDYSPLSSQSVLKTMECIGKVASGNTDALIMLYKIGAADFASAPGVGSGLSTLTAGFGEAPMLTFDSAGSSAAPGTGGYASGDGSSSLLGTASLRPGLSQSNFFGASTSHHRGPPADVTALKDLSRSLSNYWGGFEEIPAFVQLSTALETRLQEIDDSFHGPKPEEDDDDDGALLLKQKSDVGADVEEKEKGTEAEQMRGAVYKVVTEMLSQLLLSSERERAREHDKVVGLERHLSSFKQQLKDLRAGKRPESADAETECFWDDFESSDDAASYDLRSRRGSQFTTNTGDSAGEGRSRTSSLHRRSSRTSSAAGGRRGSRRGGGGGGAEDEDVRSNDSRVSRMSVMSGISRRSSYGGGRTSPSLASLATDKTRRSSVAGDNKTSRRSSQQSGASSSPKGDLRRRSSVGATSTASTTARVRASSSASLQHRSSIASVRSSDAGPATARHKPAPPTQTSSSASLSRKQSLKR